jgi:predicted small lipoprotein YifL
MSKRIISLMLALTMVLSLAGCRSAAPAPAPAPAPAEAPVAENYKIGIITGTVSQGEEEYQAAQNMVKKYGDIIVTATYPDNFSSETETTIANVVALSSDPEVKAIVFVQAVPGASAAIDKVRETRPDMLFVAGVAAEDPATISSKADVVMLVDEISMGSSIPEMAFEMGAKTFIHYSFARHLSYATIAARRELMIAKCEELGIEFVDVTAPDPTGDAGVSGAQQFILEDVPRQIAQYGKDTAFFSTNCGMQEPLIRSILEQGAIYPQQCCPSPYHGYPAAFNVDVAGREGDVQYMLDQIDAKLTEAGQEGRMSTWSVPVNMLMVEAGVDYAIEYIEGRTTGTNDEAVLSKIINGIAGGEGSATLSKYSEAGVELENFYMLLCDFYDFSAN